ncbi:MAG: restriction endonuclease [Desulfosporosinus sp. BRH_c37]|nr:MAG: restriction endonuclease [Desulfosporosinus sp. BRH_c37]
MHKSSIKNFAVSARKKLIEQVMQKAFQIGITAKSITELKQEAGHIILNNIPQEKGFKLQRDKLIKEIEQKGYDQLMEEVAYTWFNRFIALRFMEVNDYLSTGVRVLSSLEPNRAEPDIIREALNVDLAVDRTAIYNFQDRNDSEGLFKYLLIHQCNDLNKILPFMFETISDYTELLFPSNLLQEGSVIRDLVTSIPEEDWKEVEIIGWLYQYYISEKKDEVFADLKKNKKITKENIPAATQLFTPKWIVKYMVENSLGRLWLESHPNEELKAQWKYYLEEAEQEPEVQKQLEELKNPDLNPLTITVLDPCCGSGHILVYAFEVLYEIYRTYGYMEEDIPKLILENNLYGLDIDDRAAQLASFAVMMKARSKSRGVFSEKTRLNICAIQESNWLGNEVQEILVDREATEIEQNREREINRYLADTLKDAKEYGSILEVQEQDLKFLEHRLDEVKNSAARDLWEVPFRDVILEKLPRIILQAKIMGAKYEVVCTNPPYMGSSGMNAKLYEYVKNNNPHTKSDLFAVFIERCFQYAKPNGYISMITMQSWMFLSSFEKFREYIISKGIINLIHIGYNSFPEMNSCVAQASAFVLTNKCNQGYISTFLDLNNKYSTSFDKEKAFLNERSSSTAYLKNVESFLKIPGIPVSYWVIDSIVKSFDNDSIYSISISPSQNVTGNNAKYVRYFWEVNKSKIGRGKKWINYAKGGGYRKWYGNLIDVVDWSLEARESYRNGHASQIIKEEYWYKRAITWGLISSILPSFRLLNEGGTFDKGGSSIIITDEKRFNYILGLLNSKVTLSLINLFNSTLNFQVRDIRNIPLIIGNENHINNLVQGNITISRVDWNSLETSFDFKADSLLNYKNEAATLEQAFITWSNFTQTQFIRLKANEEELNRNFIEIYGIHDELTPEVEDKHISIRKADRERDIKSFISYAVGCMLGRYSLDEEGLIFTGGKFDPERYKTFKADDDGILPVLSDAYFEDDIVSQFAEFVKVTFGENTVATNLDYIAETLGRKANESSRECIRRYFLKDFYKDHVQMYKKRPIYWLFTSGKEQGFNVLVYMHRYDSSMVSRVRTDYLHPLQNKLEAEFLRLNQVLVSENSPTEKTKATKRLKVLAKQMDELKKYDEVIHNLADQQIEIDLDDGVVVNYAKFEKVLAKI